MLARSRGNEHDAIEAAFFAYGFGNEKMSVVNRIETAAKNPDAHGLAVQKLVTGDAHGVAFGNPEFA